MKKSYLALAAVLPTLLFFAFTRTADPLRECWNLQVKPLKEHPVKHSFTESFHELNHSFYPWQQTTYHSAGSVWSGSNAFLKADTLTLGKYTLTSALEYTSTETLFRDFAEDSLTPVSPAYHEEQLLQLARYTPALLIDFFRTGKSTKVKNANALFDTYEASVYGTTVQLSIGREPALVQEVTWLSHHEQFGDARTTVSYQSYKQENGVYSPQQIVVSKINGRLHDTINVTGSQQVSALPDLLQRPADYSMRAEPVVPESVAVQHYNDHIHFVEFSGADARSLVVEFADFLFVAEAPLNSENGERLISEAQKIAPGKPVKYFAFGHYHPHYLGGVRPFVHKGATVLTTAADEEFVRYIATAPRTLHPDSLQFEPATLKTEIIDGKKVITDGTYTLEIHFIGERSAHTNDYLLYYFPAEKLLFEDDLAWIASEGEAAPASKRQAGLYTAAVDLGLTVDTVVQGWPLKSYGVKTQFSFAELERTVKPTEQR